MNQKLSQPGSRKTEKSRILIVEDHPIFRQGMIQMINNEDDLEVCGEAETAAVALTVIETQKPDMALVDITIKGTNGIELIKNIKVSSPDLPVLVLSMHEESLYAERAMRAGAQGYVMKQEAAAQVMLAIRTVLKGELYLSAAMNIAMIRKFVSKPQSRNHSGVDGLTDRELEIAGELHISIKTIETHRGNLKDKLALNSAPELVRFAMEWVASKL